MRPAYFRSTLFLVRMRGEKGRHPVATKEDKTFVGPRGGAHPPVLDIVHKVSAEDSGGSLTIEEWGLPRG